MVVVLIDTGHAAAEDARASRPRAILQMNEVTQNIERHKKAIMKCREIDASAHKRSKIDEGVATFSLLAKRRARTFCASTLVTVETWFHQTKHGIGWR